MNQFLESCTKALSLTVLVVLGLAACNSQGNTPDGATQDNPTAKPPLPHMWVGDSLSIADEANYHFLAGLLAYDLSTPETDSIYYTSNEFIGMIDTFALNPCIEYVVAYPAAFGSSGAPNDNKLTVLFQPIDTCGGLENYYLLPENASSFVPGDCLQPSATATAMINNYKTLKLNARLNAIVNAKDLVNHEGRNPSLPATNTRHVIYLMEFLKELKGEISYQLTLDPTHPISGFRMFFSSKNPNGTGQNAYDDRLYMLYEFTKDYTVGKHEVFRINPAGRAVPKSVAHFSLKGGYDNGQLCPPTCNP
jgi:hypothetical protein